MIIPLAASIVVLLVIISFFLSNRGKRSASFCKMLLTGLESGFSLNQILFLYKIGKRVDFENCTTLFRSPSVLDKCIAEVVREAKSTGSETEKGMQKMLSLLYERRRKMDLDQSIKKRGIITTRYIKSGQAISIVSPGIGVFSSKVISNFPQYLVIDFPRAPLVTSTKIEWENKPVTVYFSHANDASYAFSSIILPYESGHTKALLKLKHSDDLVRSQMRKNTRIKCAIPARLYIMEDTKNALELESEPGMKCILKNLSCKGAMILIGGKAFVGMKIKIQFVIQGELIAMAGIARGVHYNASKNRSIINFDCTSMDPKMKNDVLAFIYNALPEIQKEYGDSETLEDLLLKDSSNIPDFVTTKHLKNNP